MKKNVDKAVDELQQLAKHLIASKSVTPWGHPNWNQDIAESDVKIETGKRIAEILVMNGMWKK